MERRNFIRKTAAVTVLGSMGNVSGAFGKERKQTAGIRRKLGKTGFEVFPVGYGGIVSMSDGQAASNNYVAWAIDRGINYFDVAPGYQDAQEKLGNSLKSFRKNVYLACKTGQRLYEEAKKDFERSLQLLHTDYFDVYQMHGLSKQEDIDRAFGPDGVMKLMIKAREEGQVRKLGITAHSEEVALRALELYDFDTVMFPLNWMMNRYSGMGTGLCREIARRGAGLLAIKPLIHRHWIDSSEREGSAYPNAWCKPIDTFTDKPLALAALKYSLQLGPDVLIPPGDFKSFFFAVDHIEEILARPSLSREETALLDREFDRVKAYPFFI
jgi:hypothetical protein